MINYAKVTCEEVCVMMKARKQTSTLRIASFDVKRTQSAQADID